MKSFWVFPVLKKRVMFCSDLQCYDCHSEYVTEFWHNNKYICAWVHTKCLPLPAYYWSRKQLLSEILPLSPRGCNYTGMQMVPSEISLVAEGTAVQSWSSGHRMQLNFHFHSIQLLEHVNEISPCGVTTPVSSCSHSAMFSYNQTM